MYIHKITFGNLMVALETRRCDIIKSPDRA